MSTDPAANLPQAPVTVNGTVRSLAAAGPAVNALDWLRGIGLTGAKEGCAEGECGACAVLVARPGLDAPTEWTAINACLVPAAALVGQEVVTAEGLGTPEALHPVQAELAGRGGSQCGYCTPGFVCSMAAEFYRPGRAEFDHHALSGNLCRCTGYRPIMDAAAALGAPSADDPLRRRTTAAAPLTRPVRLTGWVRPGSLDEALAALDGPGAVAVAGSTDLGVEANLRGARPALLVAIDQLDELRSLEVGADFVEIGAALSLSEIERQLAGRVPLLDEVFPQFASRLIRNGATIGGNLGTGSPIGDLPPALLALSADVVLVSRAGERVVPLADYFTGYRETVLQPGELIGRVRIPQPLAPMSAFHKIAKRRFDDISSVAVAFAIEVSDGVVGRAAIGLGGVAATPIRAAAAEAALVGQPWSAATVQAAAEVLSGEGTPLDDHRASASYRRAMLRESLLGFEARSRLDHREGA
ncbi:MULTISPECIES: xanthine dehydrogenase small subunit [unclassified Nocardioides]|uniref:xanthine dehydrogenase small subunit n=1 Tax=unclassified Nocardioides TaxID=2615069 RepID=UPI0006FDC031|nr:MULTISPECIES: FAD binding domain-containing protein [unclassified Nocardioides]KRA31385.1 xanthine dehydrogenase small subunit [Nocardioides sp. Root614]KRA88005.1 xanthine dehydrogenase small subunit [Nocardioides sp. Root682]